LTARDEARYWSEIAISALSTCIPLREFASEYCHDVTFGTENQNIVTDGEKNFEDMFIRFDRIHERERRTDTA